MSNPNDQTSEYTFPPHNGGQYGQQQGWGQPQGNGGHQTQAAVNRPKKKGKTGKILLALALVLVLLVALAEFGARAYMKNQIVEGLQQQATEHHLQLAGDPAVSFGKSPVLLGLFSKSLNELNMTIPSSLNISYQDSDKSKPVVQGNPEVKFHGEDITMDQQGQTGTIGKMTMNTAIPSEYMLAQVQKNAADQPQQGGAAGFLQQAITVTGIKPLPDEQALEVEISGGLASIKMKPTVENGELKMQAEGGEVFGFSLPETFLSNIQDSLSSQTSEVGPAGMEFKNVTVTNEGMDVELFGSDVDMSELAQSVEETPGSNTGNGDGSDSANSGTSGSNGSGTAGALNEQQQNPGEAIGSAA